MVFAATKYQLAFAITPKDVKHVDMDPILNQELAESELFDVPRLVEHLFPDTLFSMPLESIVFAVKKGHWKRSTHYWKGFSPALKNTENLACFLNDICGTISTTAREHQSFSKRAWVTENRNPFSGVLQVKRGPEICLVNDSQAPTWSSGLAVLEFRSSKKERSSAYSMLAKRASKIFSTQDERRFVIGVSLCFSDVRVYVFDRAGVVGSVPFDLRTNPEMLVRVLAGLLWADVGTIGLDPSIRHGEDGKRYVTVDAVEYQIVKTLYNSETIRGRGTICWHARRDEVDCVIKNTWTDISRPQTEADVLRIAEGVEGIAHLAGEDVVWINGKEDSTAHIRSVVANLDGYHHQTRYEKLEVRVHRRIVTTPVGEPLTHFRSKKELLRVFIDAIEAHRRLVEKHILHRDVSIGNIMIVRGAAQENSFGLKNTVHGNVFANRDPEPLTTSRPDNSSLLTESKNKIEGVKGILVDLDYALITHDPNGKKIEGSTEPITHRMGTLPFMAIEVLKGLKLGQEYEVYHDMQSFFFVLLWVALEYAGPNNAKRRDLNIEDNIVRSWLQGSNSFWIGTHKAQCITSLPKHFEDGITRHFRPYFNDLKPCIEELRQRIFFSANSAQPIGHQDFIDILEKAIAKLPDDDRWSCKNDPVGYGATGGKRKFETECEEETKGGEVADIVLESDESWGSTLGYKRAKISCMDELEKSEL